MLRSKNPETVQLKHAEEDREVGGNEEHSLGFFKRLLFQRECRSLQHLRTLVQARPGEP